MEKVNFSGTAAEPIFGMPDQWEPPVQYPDNGKDQITFHDTIHDLELHAQSRDMVLGISVTVNNSTGILNQNNDNPEKTSLRNSHGVKGNKVDLFY